MLTAAPAPCPSPCKSSQTRSGGHWTRTPAAICPSTRSAQAGVEYALTSALCTTDFAAQAPYLIATPAALHQVVAGDYATRWPDLLPPSPEDVAEFCAAARIVVTECSFGFDEHLAQLGLVLGRDEAI